MRFSRNHGAKVGYLRIEVPGQAAESALTVSRQRLLVQGHTSHSGLYRFVDAVTAAVSSTLAHVSPLLPHDHLRGDGARGPCGHGKPPSHGLQLYNVWLLPGDDKLRPDSVSPLIRVVQRLDDDCLCLLA